MYVLDKSSPSNLNFLNSPLLVLSCPNYSLNPNRKCPGVPQSSISAHHFPNNPSFSKVSEPPGQNQQNRKQCCLPPLLLKISLNDTSFHTSFNFHISLQNFEIHDVKIPRKWIESMNYYSCPNSPHKALGRSF